MKFTRRIFVLIIALSPLLAVFMPEFKKNVSLDLFTGWGVADIRYLEEANPANPESDIVALYTRSINKLMELRLDILANQPDVLYDLYIAIDYLPGGILTLPFSVSSERNWDLLIQVSPSGEAFLFDSNGKTMDPGLVTVIKDLQMDSIIVQFNEPVQGLVSQNSTLQAFLISSIDRNFIDTTPAIQIESTSMGTPSPTLLVIWNTFPVITPAQVLRHWDGAHTGPYGRRHGLSQLLQAVSKYEIPVFLLDLKNLSGLSALDYLGALDEIQDLQERQLIILPENSSGSSPGALQSLEINRQTGHDYGLADSLFVFSPGLGVSQKLGLAAFANLADRHHVQNAAGMKLIPTPFAIFPAEGESLRVLSERQIDQAGLTLTTKKELLLAAQNNDPNDLVVLGGSLPDSAWGESTVAPIAFRYLANHPWIHLLNQESLLTLRGMPSPSASTTGCRDLLCTPSLSENDKNIINAKTTELFQKLETAPKNQLTNLAWQAYFYLTSPEDDEKLFRLKANYMGRVDDLIDAATWAQNPRPLKTCDPDDHGFCILASNNIYTLIAKDGARVLLAIKLTPGGPREFIASTSQFAVGLSDPNSWQLEKGEGSDPSVIPGAFSDLPDPFIPFKPTINSAGIQFINSDQGIQKTFELIDSSIEVSYLTNIPISTQIPFPLNPESRERWGWANLLHSPKSDSNSWDWVSSENNEIRASCTGAQIISSESFLDSRASITQPEDPNLAYPAGHFLPIPVAVIQLSSSDSFNFKIQFIDSTGNAP